MALIAPLAGAALGGVLSGGAMWAMSAGWLIGSWLFQKDGDDKNQIFDPGAQEMPRFNQALRGVTMPVTFGTNRVSSNIVWQNAFTTIRHESTQGGGGGKGGGSGMGSKGGGPQSTQVTYEYKWDLLMHIGMSDGEVSLFGGWVGSDRLNGDTLLAIINNSNTGLNSLFRSDVDRPQNASLSFDEGFFHGSQETNDANAANWDHFESVEGQPFRFPYTYYIGFKQLNLGGQAAVPQLSWEIGPGNLDLTFNSNHIDFWSSATSVFGTGGLGPTGGVVTGTDGVRYQVDFSGGNTQGKLRDVDTGVDIDTMSDIEFDAFATSIGLDPGVAYDFTASTGMQVVPNTNFVLAYGQDLGTGLRSNWAFVLFTVDSTGFTAVGGYQGRSTSLEGLDGNPVIAIIGEGTDDDPIVLMDNSKVGADQEYHIYKIPSINELKAVLLEDTASLNFQTRTQSLRTAVTEIQSNFGNHESYRAFDTQFGFIVPTVSVSAGGPSWGSKLMFYIGKSDIEWHIDNPADITGTQTIYDLIVSHPNGGIFSVTIEEFDSQTFTIGNDWTDESGNFIDHASQSVVVPFADSGFAYDETTVQDADDYDVMPHVQHLGSGAAAGATLVVFWKNVSPGSGDRDAITGTSTQAQVFLWNPLEQVAERYDKVRGSFADTDTDWGIGAASAYSIAAITGFFDESTNEILVTGYVNGDGATHNIFLAKFGDFNVGGGEDVFPPFIIRKILTSEVFGIGIADSTINQASYELALQYCEAEGIKVSVQYRREENVLQIITDLLALYGGFLVDSGGEIKFLLQEFTPIASLARTIDNDHLLVNGEEAPVLITRGARQDTFNKIKVNYLDRNLEYRQNFIEIADEVDMDLNGTRPQEFPAKFVMDELTANKIAVRALWGNLYARDIYNFKLGPKDSDLEPGDVVTLVDSFHPSLSGGKQVRITLWVESEPLKFNVTAVDEIEYVSEAVTPINSTTAATVNPLFGPAHPVAGFTMYELPKEFQGANAQVYVGYRQQNNAKGARLYTSADGVSFAQVQEAQPFIISGILSDALPNRGPGYVDENVEVHLMPDTVSGNFSVNSFTYAQTFQLDDVSASGRALGGGLIFVNSEMIAYEGVNLIGQNNYRFDKMFRGWGGTHIQEHSSGDTWHKHGGGMFTQAVNEDKIGTIIHYKVAPFNFAGVEFDIASVDARTYQIQGTFFRPQNGPALQTFIHSPGSFLTVQSEDLGFITKKNVIAGGSDIQFEWFDAARVRGYGARGYGTGGYGRFENDTTSVQWRVEVLSNDLSTVVRCTTVSTTAFVYSLDINSTDFNAWNGAFALRVTPFNEFGTALRSRTKILELFE